MEFLQPYLTEILGTIFLAVATFIGTSIKKLYKDYINTKTKKEIVECTVKYVDQVFKELHGQEKFDKAVEKSLEWMNEKGINISQTELEILIEASVNEFKKALK